MHKFRKIVSVTAAWLFLSALLALAPSVAIASLKADSPLPTPVPPEPYPNSDVYPAVVYLASEADLQTLYDLNIDMDGLRPVSGVWRGSGGHEPALATIYINPIQSSALVQAGITPVPIPNEGYRSFLDHGPGTDSPPGWPTFAQYVARMQALQAAHPDIVSLVSIGQSVQHRELWCMEVSDYPGLDEFEPEFKYTANHHGDETTGIEMTVRFAEYLADNYGIDQQITDLVDKMEIWLCPIYNPDGYVNGSRYNYNGVDLNRNYPDRFEGYPPNPQPETLAFMNFETNHRFVMGANYHGGAQVLNYPWDAVADPDNPIYAPDDRLFYDFGIGYTSRNPDLWEHGLYEHGITRGFEWYMIYGGMQDWDYYYNGEHHVTIEISWDKNPEFNLMDTYWNNNREAMLWWMQRAWTGLAGMVVDVRNNAPLDASVTLVGMDLPNTILTDPDYGDYHRVISAGLYTLEASAAGYQNQSMDVWTYDDSVNGFDFTLCPSDSWSVSGTVSDAVSGLPLDGYIEFTGSRQAIHTDPATGYYSMPICPFTYTMRVTADWHYPEERLVTIDQNQIQDFALQPTANLSDSYKDASTLLALPGDIVQYHLHGVNSGASTNVLITDTLPAEVTWTGELTATQGTPVFDAGRILWQGNISATEPITISYAVSLNPCLVAGLSLLNIAEFDDGYNGTIQGKVDLKVANAAPTVPTSPSPVDLALDQPITIPLAWSPSSDLNCDALSYDIAFGTTPTPGVVAIGLTATSFDPGILLYNTTYYWQVIAHDGLSETFSPVWSFTTVPGPLEIYLPFTSK